MKLTKKQRHIAYINATKDWSNNSFSFGLCYAVRTSSGNLKLGITPGEVLNMFPEISLFSKNKAQTNVFYWKVSHINSQVNNARAMGLAFLIAMTR